MSEAIIAKKAAEVAAVKEKVEAAASVVVVDYLGLTVEQDTQMRQELRKAGVEYKVIKNSIMRRALDELGIEFNAEVFTGPTAVAFSNEDVVAPAKILADYAKKIEVLEIKGGLIEGKSSSADDINALASLPSREGLLSMLLSVLQAPVRNVALAVKAVAEAQDEVA